VNQQVVKFALSLLARIRRPSLIKALHMCGTTPGLSFVYGGLVIGTAVNVFSSVIMSDTLLTKFQKNFIWVLGSSVIVFPLAVFLWLFVGELRRRIR
jgi:hypothetical protein